ncbi:hypothetical protein NA56DRAFT_454036 [Hyaloscypha hepaticicola]|uniref:Uncharacterized protein n=1 Tax=Hyaloscypha hepaticicola TaxID=2082293 RepID=A0A2J6PFJ6_9HELO|nr:hypothetical protein NA56DRAFT_454036 [Hyaloscypha hepaticicola]
MTYRTTQQSKNEPKVVPTRPQRPDFTEIPEFLTFQMLDIYDEQTTPPSPKPEPPPKELLTGPRFIPPKYAAVASPKEATPAGPAPPKLIPLKFLSPPSPEDSEDDSFPYPFRSLNDIVDDTPAEVAPLRISKSSENSSTSNRIVNPISSRSNIDLESTTQARNNELESTVRGPNIDFQSPARSPYNDSNMTIQAPTSLTDHLVSRASPIKLYNATHSTFLRCCSDGRINVPTLSRYLTQERIFLQAYIRYLALLLANVSVPSRPKPLSSPSQSSTQGDRRINARLTPHLIARLSHAQTQLSLFSDLAVNIPDLNLESWGEETEDGMTDATRMLIRLFEVIGSAIERGEKSVLVGMVVMWVREKAHLEAWKEVQSTLTIRNQPHQPEIVLEDPAASRAVQNYILPCFTGNETAKQMGELTELLDEIWCDKNLGEGEGKRGFEERSHVLKGSPRNLEKGWEGESKEFEAMMEIVLGIMARGWPEGGS